MTNPTKQTRITRALRALKRSGKKFTPSDIAFALNVTTKEITAELRQYPEAVLIQKAHARRMKTPYWAASEPMYYPSVWQFQKPAASLKEGVPA